MTTLCKKRYEGVGSESTCDCAQTQERSVCIRLALIFSLSGLFEWSMMCFREGVCLPADGEVGVSELDPMEPRPRPWLEGEDGGVDGLLSVRILSFADDPESMISFKALR